MAESDQLESVQLTLDPSVAPAGILAGDPEHEGSDRRSGGWVGLVVGAGGSAAASTIRGHPLAPALREWSGVSEVG